MAKPMVTTTPRVMVYSEPDPLSAIVDSIEFVSTVEVIEEHIGNRYAFSIINYKGSYAYVASNKLQEANTIVTNDQEDKSKTFLFLAGFSQIIGGSIGCFSTISSTKETYEVLDEYNSKTGEYSTTTETIGWQKGHTTSFAISLSMIASGIFTMIASRE